MVSDATFAMYFMVHIDLNTHTHKWSSCKVLNSNMKGLKLCSLVIIEDKGLKTV